MRKEKVEYVGARSIITQDLNTQNVRDYKLGQAGMFLLEGNAS